MITKTRLQGWQEVISELTDPTYGTIKFSKEYTMNETSTLRTQAEAISATRSQLYIVGSVASNGDFSFSAAPTVQRTPQDARQECKRLAAQNPGKMFVFVRLQGAELIPTTPTISI